MAHAWGTLLSAVRTGKPAYHEAFGRGFWDDLDAHPDIAAKFDALMGPAGHGVPDWRVLLDPADWESVRTVVDVGGGTGSLLAEILRARPEVRGTLVDLPRPVARSARSSQAAGVADRVTAVAQSFFDPLPAGGDLYVLKNVLGDWPDREATAILTTLRGSGAAVGPRSGLHRRGTWRRSVAGVADDGPGGRQGPNAGRVPRDGSRGGAGSDGGGTPGLRAA